jgi:multidrug efflux pump subunit AcrA (membrane-fusion protein)
MRFLTRSLIGIFLASLTVAFLGYAGFVIIQSVQSRAAAADRPRIARERVFSVLVVTLAPQSLTPVLSAFGEVRARRSLELRSPAAGRVLRLAEGFEDGAMVQAGQMLLQIDPADAQAAFDLAQTEMARVEAESRDATRALELSHLDVAAAADQADLRERALLRRQNLAERGVGSEAATEESELAAASARQAVLSRRQAEASAEARLDQANNAVQRQSINLAEAARNLDDTTVTAAFMGALADVNVVEGGIVSNNERLAQLIDPDALEVSFRVSTSQYLRLLDADGALVRAPVHVSLEVEGTSIETNAELHRVSANVGEGQSGRIIYAQMDAARGFRPGDFVTVEVSEALVHGVAILPASAVDATGRVLVLAEGDRLESALVELVRRQGNDIIVRVGALAGREVVAEIGPMLGAGILVNPIRRGEDGAEATPDAPEQITLDPARRAALVALVEANNSIPDQARARILAQLEQEQVPARMIERLESGADAGAGRPRRGG